jgi:hypothetical protein
MTLRLIQMESDGGERIVAASAGGMKARRVQGATSVYALANSAIGSQSTLAAVVDEAGYGEDIDLNDTLRCGRVLVPVDHPDSARTWLTGTGLTHLGSADARDRMHTNSRSPHASDSMKMFRMGVEGGKPADGEPGVQPEWFYKGDGRSLIAPEQPLTSPEFALNGGEEPELAGIYVISGDGTPFRLGYTLANEFSDHVMERMNYLYLAHSKLRQASIGPELLVGELPADMHGNALIRRAGKPIWERPFLTGEANMSHYLSNLEHHHFKYPLFRRPGDLHVHFFGTATISFGDGVIAQDGDVFEIEAPPFSLPLRNPLRRVPAPSTAVGVL